MTKCADTEKLPPGSLERGIGLNKLLSDPRLGEMMARAQETEDEMLYRILQHYASSV